MIVPIRHAEPCTPGTRAFLAEPSEALLIGGEWTWLSGRRRRTRLDGALGAHPDLTLARKTPATDTAPAQ